MVCGSRCRGLVESHKIHEILSGSGEILGLGNVVGECTSPLGIVAKDSRGAIYLLRRDMRCIVRVDSEVCLESSLVKFKVLKAIFVLI